MVHGISSNLLEPPLLMLCFSQGYRWLFAFRLGTQTFWRPKRPLVSVNHTPPVHIVDFESRFFIIAIIAALCMGMQNYFYSSSATALMSKLKSLSFKAILRQDSRFGQLLCLCYCLTI